MLTLIEILALIVVNALIQQAFVRWKAARPVRRRKPAAGAAPVPVAFHYPQHPSPVAAAVRPVPARESDPVRAHRLPR